MLKQNHSTDTQSDCEIVIIRVFNAPRELVFPAWTEPKHIEQWWGPKGFTTRVEQMDLRPGGTWRYVMCGPDGTEYPVNGVFREVVPPERLVTSDEFDEGFEQVVKVDLPSGTIVATAIFEDLGDKTRLTLRIMHSTAEERRKHEEMGVVAGWNSSFECLDEHLATL
ncbi:MAG: SRPBCC domain-containing protein [Microcystaceae cyanobacterium]